MVKEVIIIVGASGGIGRYLMTDLARDYRTIGTYFKHNPFKSEWLDVYRERSGGVEPEMHKLELEHDDVSWFASKLQFQKTVLVNAAGISINGMAHKITHSWYDVLNVNLNGPFLTCQAFLPYMREMGWGRIVNLCSVVGQRGIPGTASYSASKAGLEGLTRTLSAENAGKGITVNALALGYFNVGMIHNVPLPAQEKIRASIPSHLFGHPSNIAEAIRFLIKADYVTGATINIDGGLV